MNMNKTRLEEILSGFSNCRVLVIGDYYLDGYWEVDQTKSALSLETPWHVNPVVGQRYYPGAAGTVVNNLCALGAKEVHCVGIIGKDVFGDMLLSKLHEEGAAPDGLMRSDNSITQIYLKVIHHGYGDIVMEGPRFDFENRKPLSKEDEGKIVNLAESAVGKVDAVIVADQMPLDNFGVITGLVRERLINLADKNPAKIFYADSRTRIGKFRNMIIKPNRFEAKQAVEPGWTGKDVDNDDAEKCSRELSRRTGKPVYVTLGSNGLIVTSGDNMTRVPGIKVQGPLDIVGAGDSVTSGIVLSLVSGANPFEAGFIGNIIGSVTITKIGITGTASPDEIRARFDEIT